MTKLEGWGSYLAMLREQAGFKSQGQFSNATGISRPTISRIESEIQRPAPETLAKISEVTGHDFYELMYHCNYVTFMSEVDDMILRTAENHLGKELNEKQKKYISGQWRFLLSNLHFFE